MHDWNKIFTNQFFKEIELRLIYARWLIWLYSFITEKSSEIS